MKNIPNRYGFIPYRAADVYKKCVQYQRAANFASHPTSVELDIIREVIEVEQPLFVDELCRRVAPLYNRGKITDVFRSKLVNIITDNRYLGKDVVYRDSFVYLRGFNNLQVRYRTEDGIHQRNILNVCLEELMMAVQLVLKAHTCLSESDLCSVVSRELGFFKQGCNISAYLSRAIQRMRELGDVVDSRGNLTLSRSGRNRLYCMGNVCLCDSIKLPLVPSAEYEECIELGPAGTIYINRRKYTIQFVLYKVEPKGFFFPRIERRELWMNEVLSFAEIESYEVFNPVEVKKTIRFNKGRWAAALYTSDRGITIEFVTNNPNYRSITVPLTNAVCIEHSDCYMKAMRVIHSVKDAFKSII